MKYWLKKAGIAALLIVVMLFCSSIFYQTGSAADERHIAEFEWEAMSDDWTSVYYEGSDEQGNMESEASALPWAKSEAVEADDSVMNAEAGEATDPQRARNENSLLSYSKISAEEEGDDPLAAFSLDDWELILVNKQHPIPDDYSFELGSIHNGLRVDKRITDKLDAMLSAAADDGVPLLVISPYRNGDKQKDLFDKKVKRALKNEESYLDAYRETAQAVTIPGSSEHEIGLAADLTTKAHITLDAEYAESEGGKWLAANCTRFGFILRYPVGKEKITGIEYEPWHFRYVGREAAEYITEHDLSLEEFVSLLKERESAMEQEKSE